MNSQPFNNTVRQVLMNELGLTRESVRTEMMRIVEDTITRAFNDSKVDARINRLIEAKIQTALNPYRHASGDLEKLVRSSVQASAKEAMTEIIRDQLEVSLSIKPSPTSTGE